MKRVLVLIKEVPDEDNVKINEDTWTINRGIGIINPADFTAIQLALELKKEGYSLEVMTMGPLTSKRILQFCLAIGFDNAYIVSDTSFAGSDTLATSLILANAIKYIGIPEIILCGAYSFDGSTGHIPLQIGEILMINTFSNVDFINTKGDVCEIVCEYGKKYIIETGFPLIASLMLKENSIFLVDADKYFINYNIKEIDNNILKIESELIGLKGSPTRVINIKSYIPKKKREVYYFSSINIKKIIDIIKGEKPPS